MTESFAVVGASGYLGRRVFSQLQKLGPAVGISSSAVPGVKKLDARNEAELVAFLAAKRPSVIINAAGTAVGSDDHIWEINVGIARSLLNWARENGARIVSIGSAAEYGVAACSGLPLTETTDFQPISSYGKAKCEVSELFAEAYRNGVEAIVGRLFNIAGPEIDSNQPLGEFVNRLRAFAREEGIISIRSAQTSRDFVTVSFAIAALVAIATTPVSNSAVNICSGKAVSYEELVSEIAAQLELPVEVVDLGEKVPIPIVIGDPTLLARTYGIAESPTVSDLAAATLHTE